MRIYENQLKISVINQIISQICPPPFNGYNHQGERAAKYWRWLQEIWFYWDFDFDLLLHFLIIQTVCMDIRGFVFIKYKYKYIQIQIPAWVKWHSRRHAQMESSQEQKRWLSEQRRRIDIYQAVYFFIKCTFYKSLNNAWVRPTYQETNKNKTVIILL